MFKELCCAVFGHKYIVFAKPTEDWAYGIRWLKCTRCKRDFAINDTVRCIIPMTFDLMDLHRWRTIKQDGKPAESIPELWPKILQEFDRIQLSRRGGFGALNNVYLPQLNCERIDTLADELRQALYHL